MNTPSFDHNPSPSWREVMRSFAFILITVGVAYFVTIYIGIENLRATVLSAGILGPLIIVLLKATTIVVVPLGGGPIYAIAGALFGFWQGLAWSLLGDALGATIAFYLSKFFGRSILHFFMGRHELPMVEKLVSGGVKARTLLKTRFFLIGFPELFAYASGLTTVSYAVFIIIHMSLHLVSDALMVAFGDLIVSASLSVIVLIGVISLALAFIGIKWLHVDVLKSG